MERDQLRAMLRDMLLARRFEERAAEEYTKGHIAGFLHLYPGEEAVAVGSLHAAEPSDWIVSTYREHVHAMVRGMSPRTVMAELFGKRTGCSRGMGGSMHLFDRERRFTGGYAIVGETYPVAIGIGYAVAMRGLPEAVLCFFGDGAVNQGTFHESLNMAKLWNLPVLFLCENNHYQIGTEIHRHSAVAEVYQRACAHRIPARRIDGMDVLAVHEATREALAQIRAGNGPQLLEFETYRFRGHSMSDAGAYRPRVELEAWQRRDPLDARPAAEVLGYPSQEQIDAAGEDCIGRFCRHLGREGVVTDAELEALRKEVEEIVEDSVRFALESPEPDMQDAWDSLYAARGQEVLL
ncbi:MAG: pyruvate dehydrogenase (acetyl-transferring) E1 component subunit alpha [Gammaproteobacteria bacterium]|nr:MAG: pyruvate dehydrogenase (acetyl-transferring) E1 component subunit alpha [Gammaproteobacteria bacterium]